MFDLNSVQVVGGSWRSQDSTAIWRLNNLSSKGSVELLVKTANNYPIKRLGDRNFTLPVSVQMRDENYVAVAQSENKVRGNVEIVSQGYFRDAATGIVNNGPFPPKVSQPTQYTIHWLLTNYATDVRNIVVKATLPRGG